MLLAAALALSGCAAFEDAHPGNPATQGRNFDAAKTAALTAPHDFNGSLARNYYAVASQRARDQDWTDSDYFARKSLAAGSGETMVPERAMTIDNPPGLGPSEVSSVVANSEEPHNWLIPGNGNPGAGEPAIMDNARANLVAALDRGGRAKFPTVAARAQALYDSWLERSEHLGAAAFNGDAHQGFLRDYTDLIVLLDRPAMRNAYFDYGRATLTASAQLQIKEAAALIKDGTAHLKIVGKADRAGKAGYNELLSQRRARAVRDALIANGIAVDRIEMAWTGETQLPVRTKDGVRQAMNRVVQMETQMPASQVAELPE